VIEVLEVPCGCFVYFTDIQMNGYRELRGRPARTIHVRAPRRLARMAMRIALLSGQTGDGGHASADRGR
jgi:hypothetical protein